jgi:nicotinamidase-related amidase
MSQLVIEPSKTALVAIDLQNAVVQMNPAPYGAEEVVSNNGRISNVLRAKGGLVVWVRIDINQANVLEHRAASWWADTDDGLCDLPGLAFGRCSFRGRI